MAMNDKTETKVEEKIEKNPAQLARESIVVTTAKETEQPEKEEAETKEEETEVEPTKEEIETKEDAIEQHEKTEEDLETEKAEAKTAAEKAKIQKRIDKEVSRRKALESENAELKRKLAAKPDAEKVLTEEDVEARSEKKANDKVIARQFANDCNKLAEAASKLSTAKEFDAKIEVMKEEIGPIPGQMIGILTDIDNGGEVLNYLVNNLDEMEDINSYSPAKMALTLAKLSDKLELAKKPKPKPLSKVPAPNTPVGGNGGGNDVIITQADTKNMPEYVRKRAIQDEARRKQKLGMR